MGRGAEGNGIVCAALLVLCSLGVRHGWQLCAVQQCNSSGTVIQLDQLWEPKSTLGTSPIGWVSGIVRAAVGVSARCRLHSWGLTPLCRHGQQDGVWKSCPLPPLGNRWKLSDWKHPLGCSVEETAVGMWLSSVGHTG